MRDPANAHWRNIARTPQFFSLDARAALPLVLFFLHIRWWTFFLAISVVIFFGIIQKFGFTLPVFRRWLKVFLGGGYRSARPWWRLNQE